MELYRILWGCCCCSLCCCLGERQPALCPIFSLVALHAKVHSSSLTHISRTLLLFRLLLHTQKPRKISSPDSIKCSLTVFTSLGRYIQQLAQRHITILEMLCTWWDSIYNRFALSTSVYSSKLLFFGNFICESFVGITYNKFLYSRLIWPPLFRICR